MKYCVYILKDDNDVFYIGSTNNLERRMSQHKNKYTKTTARMNNPKLVLFQEYNSLAMARSVELRIKKLKRKDYVEKMIKDGYIRIKSD